MPAPKKNTNARKGNRNRRMWAQRLPVNVIEIIKVQAEAQQVSQADFVAGLVWQYNNVIQADATTTAPGAGLELLQSNQGAA